MESENINRKSRRPVAKVPIIMQMEAVECGAACLCMILSYYGKQVSLEQMRWECGVSRHGTSARNLLRTARAFHLKAHGYKYEPADLRKEGIFPCIIHWNFAHFVVLKGFKGNKAYINDPELGSIAVPMDKFDQAFTGIVLFMLPEKQFVKDTDGKKQSLIRSKNRYLFYQAAFLMTMLMIVASITTIIIAALSSYFIDYLLSGYYQGAVGLFAIAFGLMIFLQVAALGIGACEIIKYKGRIGIDAGISLMEKILRLPVRFFVQRRPSDLLERLASCMSMPEIALDVMVPFWGNAVLLILYMTIMCRYSIELTAIGLFYQILNLWISAKLFRRRENTLRVMRHDESRISGLVLHGMKSIETLKANGAESGFFTWWSGYQANMNRQHQQIHDSESWMEMQANILRHVAFLGICIMGSYMLMQGRFTLGMILTFQLLFLQSTISERRFMRVQTAWMNVQTDYARYNDILEYEEEDILHFSPPGQEQPLPEGGKLQGGILMKEVCYGYVKLKEPLLEKIDLAIAPGEKVAIVGAAGAGKTTIVRLLAGLMKPWEGEILYDGKPLSEMDGRRFRREVAVVNQECKIFEGTVQENICNWEEDVDLRDMIRAAKDACLQEEILKWTEGYQHKVTAWGDNLSGGQRQKLEIARALMQNPSVLILDEATSELDEMEEREILKNICAKDITCVIITHRLASTRKCNCIYVMDGGQILESGTHEELMEHDGRYAELIRS